MTSKPNPPLAGRRAAKALKDELEKEKKERRLEMSVGGPYAHFVEESHPHFITFYYNGTISRSGHVKPGLFPPFASRQFMTNVKVKATFSTNEIIFKTMNWLADRGIWIHNAHNDEDGILVINFGCLNPDPVYVLPTAAFAYMEVPDDVQIVIGKELARDYKEKEKEEE